MRFEPRTLNTEVTSLPLKYVLVCVFQMYVKLVDIVSTRDGLPVLWERAELVVFKTWLKNGLMFIHKYRKLIDLVQN